MPFGSIVHSDGVDIFNLTSNRAELLQPIAAARSYFQGLRAAPSSSSPAEVPVLP